MERLSPTKNIFILVSVRKFLVANLLLFENYSNNLSKSSSVYDRFENILPRFRRHLAVTVHAVVDEVAHLVVQLRRLDGVLLLVLWLGYHRRVNQELVVLLRDELAGHVGDSRCARRRHVVLRWLHHPRRHLQSNVVVVGSSSVHHHLLLITTVHCDEWPATAAAVCFGSNVVARRGLQLEWRRRCGGGGRGVAVGVGNGHSSLGGGGAVGQDARVDAAEVELRLAYPLLQVVDDGDAAAGRVHVPGVGFVDDAVHGLAALLGAGAVERLEDVADAEEAVRVAEDPGTVVREELR